MSTAVTDHEKLLWVYLNFNYNPEFLFKNLKTRLKDSNYGHFKLKAIDKLDIPFSLEQVTTFLEACASLTFFCHKNGIKHAEQALGSGVEQHVEMISNIHIK
jgi:hypothetical protein